uniref:Uncharacterized protein n=1 Tax=Arundo donax TaxID=35708 RepID=A0A0A9GMY4_ARUDO
MYVYPFFLKSRFTKLPNFTSVKEENVNDGRGERRKTNTICNSKESAEVQRTILLVSLCIEMEMGVHDARDVVLLPSQGE